MDELLKITKHRMTVLLSFTFLFIFGAGLILFPQESKSGISASIQYCLKVLVPTLFPFVALSSFAIYSGAADLLGRLFAGITKYIFRLPKVTAVTLILGFIGGYPSGAAGISSLLNNGQITKKQAERMLLFCVNPGIAFVISFLGAGLLNNAQTGLFLFLSVTLSGIFIGIVIAFFDKIPQESPNACHKTVSPSDAVILCAGDASRAMVKMCAAVLIFSSFYALMKGSGIIAKLSSLLSQMLPMTIGQSTGFLSMLFEVAAGTGDAVSYQVPPILLAFGLAFGGICVHFQVFSFFGEFPTSKFKFILFRFLHGTLAAVTYSIFQRAFPQTAQVFYNSGQQILVGGFTMSMAAGISLTLMCGAFLLYSYKMQLRRKE